MKKIVILFILLLSGIFVNAQVSVELSELGLFSKNSAGKGKIYFNHPPQLNDILKSKVRVKKKSNIWRIRLIMVSGTNARDRAEAFRNGFITQYPDIKAVTEYPSPYFKVFVGEFTTRIEAESFRRKIANRYPNAIVESGKIVVSDSTDE